jgi:hypothetical protein
MPPEKKDPDDRCGYNATDRRRRRLNDFWHCGHVGIDATQDFRTIDPIAKSHVIKFDGARRAGSIIGRLRRSVQDIAQAGNRA